MSLITPISIVETQSLCKSVPFTLELYGRICGVAQEALQRAKELSEQAKTLMNSGKPGWLADICAFLGLYRLLNTTKEKYHELKKESEFYESIAQNPRWAAQYCIEENRLSREVRYFLKIIEKIPQKTQQLTTQIIYTYYIDLIPNTVFKLACVLIQKSQKYVAANKSPLCSPEVLQVLQKYQPQIYTALAIQYLADYSGSFTTILSNICPEIKTCGISLLDLQVLALQSIEFQFPATV